MNRYEAQEYVRAATLACLDKARALFPTFRANPSINFNKRGSSCGGTAKGIHELSFNADWVAANPQEYVRLVVGHEVAHIVCVATGLGKGHDAGWRRVCRMLGGHAASSMDTSAFGAVRSARRTVQHLYRMPSGHEIWLSGVMHNKMLRGLKRRVIATGESITAANYTGQRKVA